MLCFSCAAELIYFGVLNCLDWLPFNFCTALFTGEAILREAQEKSAQKAL
jgi:hypothetical protein